ncbi:hypothetical protein ACFPRL_13420 [Pseudoclavibacter helvolus]
MPICGPACVPVPTAPDPPSPIEVVPLSAVSYVSAAVNVARVRDSCGVAAAVLPSSWSSFAASARDRVRRPATRPVMAAIAMNVPGLRRAKDLTSFTTSPGPRASSQSPTAPVSSADRRTSSPAMPCASDFSTMSWNSPLRDLSPDAARSCCWEACSVSCRVVCRYKSLACTFASPATFFASALAVPATFLASAFAVPATFCASAFTVSFTSEACCFAASVRDDEPSLGVVDVRAGGGVPGATLSKSGVGLGALSRASSLRGPASASLLDSNGSSEGEAGGYRLDIVVLSFMNSGDVARDRRN